MTNNLTVKTAALLIILMGASYSHARVVTTKDKQIEVIQTARSLLNSTSGSSELNLETLKDPFHLIKEEIVVEEVVEKAPQIVVRELTAAEILALAADQLKPSGFIDQGGEQYLILNGRKIQDGVSFNFPYLNKDYAIQINQIQTHSFTLNLNSESKTIPME